MSISLILLALLRATALGQARPLRFEDFQPKWVYRGTPAIPNLQSHPEARRYRTVLKAAAANGPNFAGIYRIVRIGAGTGCNILAVLNENDGTVYFPRNVHSVCWAGWWHKPYGPVFRGTSRLLVVYGRAGSEDAPYGISHFEWTGTEFKLLQFVPRDRGTVGLPPN